MFNRYEAQACQIQAISRGSGRGIYGCAHLQARRGIRKDVTLYKIITAQSESPGHQSGSSSSSRSRSSRSSKRDSSTDTTAVAGSPALARNLISESLRLVSVVKSSLPVSLPSFTSFFTPFLARRELFGVFTFFTVFLVS